MRLFERTLKTLGLDPTLDNWEQLNYDLDSQDQTLLNYVMPFPPTSLMHLTSGLTDKFDFAKHGVDIFRALRKACPKELTSFSKVLDFACGCGRAARLFYPLSYENFSGCDIDPSMIEYMKNAYPPPGINAFLSQPDNPLPFQDNFFDLIYSISVLTHLTEKSQDFILEELSRIASPGAILMLSVHGDRAMERTEEPHIFNMLSIGKNLFRQAKKKFTKGEHVFILQQGHLTTKDYSYGITFTPNKYIRNHFAKWFNILDIVDGAIHDFQSIVVLSPLKK